MFLQISIHDSYERRIQTPPIIRVGMVIAKTPDSSVHGKSHRYLDADKISKSLDLVTDKGATYAEVRLVALTDYSVSMRDGKLERAIPGQEIGATIRVLADGAWGVHSTTDISSIEEQMSPTLRLAQSVGARRSSGDKPINLAEVPIIEDSVIWMPKKDVRNTDLEDRLEHLKLFNSTASEDDKIVSVTCGWHDENIHTEFLSSEGMNRTWSFQRSLINGMVTARDGSDVVSYRTRFGGEGGLELIESCDVGGLGDNAKISALRLLKAERAPSGKMPLISDRDLTGVYIHEALGHPCEADLVAAGDSCLDGKLGQKIGSDIVTVVDDPTIRGGYGAHPIDDEGLDTTEKCLIKNGVLTDYLNHRETAFHFGLKPNAGARAQDGLHHPLVRMSNTLIHGGTHNDLEELLEDIEYGVYACGSRGGQVDTGRGSFQFAAQEAWLIENGEVTKPLKDVSVSGLTLQILKDVNGLTKESKLAAPGFCGKGQTVPVGDGGPIMRISEALVG